MFPKVGGAVIDVVFILFAGCRARYIRRPDTLPNSVGEFMGQGIRAGGPVIELSRHIQAGSVWRPHSESDARAGRVVIWCRTPAWPAGLRVCSYRDGKERRN